MPARLPETAFGLSVTSMEVQRQSFKRSSDVTGSLDIRGFSCLGTPDLYLHMYSGPALISLVKLTLLGFKISMRTTHSNFADTICSFLARLQLWKALKHRIERCLAFPKSDYQDLMTF
jgi:hypothetical protein